MPRKLVDARHRGERGASERGVRARAYRAVELVCCSSLLLAGCPVDDRALGAHAGLEFVQGGDGGSGDALGTDEGGARSASGGTGGVEEASGEAGQLEPGAGGESGSGEAQGASGGTGGTTGGTGGGTGGTSAVGAGTGGSAGFMGHCPDLDGNGVSDCDETVITNAAFDTDASGWTSETNVSLEWVANDAGGVSDSGSLGVSNTLEVTQDGSLMVGAHQCQPVNGATVYDFRTQISVPDEAPDTSGGFQITLFDGPKCTGNTLDTRSSESFTQGSAWKVAELTYLTPTVAKSVSLRLVSIKPFVQPPVTVLFDNVLMHAD